jgi:hypothetical protein
MILLITYKTRIYEYVLYVYISICTEAALALGTATLQRSYRPQNTAPLISNSKLMALIHDNSLFRLESCVTLKTRKRRQCHYCFYSLVKRINIEPDSSPQYNINQRLRC